MTPPSASLRLQGLLAEARWLESLARALVADRDEARDLVQDVWTTAAERAPERVEHPRAWLASVLRNALRVRRRAGAARSARERDVAREEHQSGPDDVVARAEAQRVLVEHVLALDEPWRSTVLLRYFDELSCEEIAQRERVPASTVRNRLASALERLRQRLAQSRGSDWMASLAPLAPAELFASAMPSGTSSAALEVSARGARAGAGSTASSTGAVVVGGLLMGTAAKLAAAIVVAGGVVWWAWSAMDAPRAPAGSETTAGAAPQREPALADAPQAPVELDAARTSVTPSSVESVVEAGASKSSPTQVKSEPALPPPPAGVLEGVVVRGDEPWTEGGTLELTPGVDTEHARLGLSGLGYAGGTEANEVRPATLDERGAFQFRDVPSESVTLLTKLTGGITLESTVGAAPRGEGRRIVVRVGTARLSGRAWDEEGRPRTGARVSVYIEIGRKGHAPSVFATTTDVDGRYALEHLPNGLARGRLVQELGGELPDFEHQFTLSLAPGSANVLDFGQPTPWPTWSGRLVTRAGSPVLGGATLQVLDDTGKQLLFTVATEQGSFRTRVASGTYTVRARLHDGWDRILDVGRATLGDADLESTLVLPFTRVSGHVVRTDGGELADVTQGGRKLQVSVHREGENYSAAFRRGTVAADGSYAIEALEPGRYVIGSWPLVLDGSADGIVVRESDLELVFDLRVKAQ